MQQSKLFLRIEMIDSLIDLAANAVCHIDFNEGNEVKKMKKLRENQRKEKKIMRTIE